MKSCITVAERASALLCVAAALGLAGCAAPAINAQWSDPQFAGRSLRGAKVLVACQAAEPTLRRICADRAAAKLSALGAVPLPSPDSGNPGLEVAGDAQALLADARAAGAQVLFRLSITPDLTTVASGPAISFGIGGFGGGYRSGGGVGVGVAAPVGGASAQTGFAGSASLTDVASERPMWSARATAPPSSDAGAQMATLADLLLDSARAAGLFPG
jgi:hypothetical protein